MATPVLIILRLRPASRPPMALLLCRLLRISPRHLFCKSCKSMYFSGRQGKICPASFQQSRELHFCVLLCVCWVLPICSIKERDYLLPYLSALVLLNACSVLNGQKPCALSSSSG